MLRRVLGSQNRRSGGCWSRLGVGPGGLWAGFGGSGEGPREISGPIFFHVRADNMEIFQNTSFPSGSAETDAE